MARKSTTKSATDTTVVESSTTVVNVIADDENMNTSNKTVIKTVGTEALKDTDEIEIMSLIPNVSYKDSYTNDIYQWDEVEHVEPIDFGTIKNMWRNHKDYFRNLLLKPLDERVIVKFGLTNTYEKYEFMMNESNYTKKNLNKLYDAISSAPTGMKYTIYNKIKDLVASGKINDIFVIRFLERKFDLDLISFI